MSLKRVILEMGHGNDMHGGDYTKAALRAVQDCIHHSSLPFLRTLGVEPKTMQIEVTIGVHAGWAIECAIGSQYKARVSVSACGQTISAHWQSGYFKKCFLPHTHTNFLVDILFCVQEHVRKNVVSTS